MNVFDRIKQGAQHKNVGSAERWLSAVAGALTLGYAMRNRRRGRIAMLLGGASLLQRGATGYCSLYNKMGVDRSKKDDLTANEGYDKIVANG